MKAIILDMYGVIVKQTGDEFVHYLVINAQEAVNFSVSMEEESFR